MLEMSSAIVTALQDEVAKEKGAVERAQAANVQLKERWEHILINF